MHTWETLLLGNVAGAILLAAFAVLVGRWTKRPALVHTVWVLVMVKLVSVPIFTPGVLGASAAAPIVAAAPTAVTMTPHASTGIAGDLRSAELIATGTPSPAHSPVAETDHGSIDPVATLRVLLPLLLLSGALIVMGLAAVRIVRFRRLIRGASPAAEAVQVRTASLARAMGMTVAPPVRLVEARISPALWPGRRCEILLPADLVPRLTTDELDTLLAHELAHLRRRDHWIRPLELAVSSLYWWFPLAWWARGRLRAAEEQACDAHVLRVLPGRARTYATGLLKTVEFVSVHESAMPGLTTAVGGATPLKERMIMILNGGFPATLTRPLRFGVVAVALTAILVSPGWVESSIEVEEPEPEAAAVAEEEAEAVASEEADAEAARHTEDWLSIIALNREELRLRKELLELESQHQALRTRIEETQVRKQQAELREQLARLEEDGNEEEAERLRLEILDQEARLDLHVRQLTFDRQLQANRNEVEFRLQELRIAQEEYCALGKNDQAQDLEAQARLLERELREIQLRSLEMDLKLRQQELEIEAEQLKRESMK